jgi:uncharacterized alpha-E superfamily protein
MMLSRIANSLFWMGRYLERTENSARMIHTHFLSALDAPSEHKGSLIYESLLRIMGMSDYINPSGIYEDHHIQYGLCFDIQNPVSLSSSISFARENARGAKDILSTEIWESINVLFQLAKWEKADRMDAGNIPSYLEMILVNSAIINAQIENSIPHDLTWSILRLGMHSERTLQVNRLLQSKTLDIIEMRKRKKGKEEEAFHLINLMRSAQALDMARMHYRRSPQFHEALDYLVLNKEFPRSIHFNMRQIASRLQKVSNKKNGQAGSPEFEAARILAFLQFLDTEDLHSQPEHVLVQLHSNVSELISTIESQYLSY